MQYKVHMEPFFLAFGTPLIEAATRGPIITPNERLASEISRFLEREPAFSGRPLICVSWRSWLTRLYTQHNRRRDHPRLLTSAGLSLCIAELPDASSESQSTLIEEAWTICHHFDVRPTSHSTAGEQFQRWYQSLHDQLAATRCISAAELEQQLQRLAAPAEHVTLVGFDDLNPAQHRLLQQWQALGVRCERLDTPRITPKQLVRIEPALTTDEIRMAAAWAKDVLINTPDATIGILVPGLESRRDAVVRQFTAILDPHAGSRSTLVDVAGGTPLNADGLWRDAECLLQSLTQPVATPSLLRVLRSAHFTLDVDVQPGDLAALTTLEAIAAISGNKTLQAMVTAAQRARSETSMLLHLETIEQLLDLAGWTLSGLGSRRFQIQQATAGAIRTLAAEATWFEAPCEFDTTLERLSAYLGRTVHAPEQPPAQIRIMGYLETPGLSFTHLWVTGASESSLPAPAHANPLLSAEAMRLAGVRRMDATSERAFADQLVSLWRSQAENLVVSHAALETGEHLSGSMLLRDLPWLALESFSWSNTPAHAWLNYDRPRTEVWEDRHVHVLPPGRLSGGTGLLRNQAACSFRAFGCHRLNLSEPDQPHALLDPLERGTLLHDVLESIMRKFPSRNALTAATTYDFQNTIFRSFAKLERFVPTLFRDAETTRLLALLQEWQLLELKRESFTVKDVEHHAELLLGDHRLSLKLDRIDATAAGTVIIDYKSGAPESFKGLLEKGATASPQLPSYALTMPEAAGVFYLNFKGEPTARGLGHTGIGTIGFGRTDQIEDWSGQHDTWREELTELVHAFVSGPVLALPANPKTCDTCHIRPICRIDTADDETEDALGESS